ncbi:MAG: PEGA domain-containing protein [Fibromonadales bacterium]|nr:PEGA domain-containing protein [Fibromonadales bacterium]
MPMSPLFILLFFALAAYGQVQERVAILNTVDDGKPALEDTELAYLTNRLREIAVKMLPENKYFVMTSQSIIEMLGSERKEECKNKCLLDMGKAISADYIGQARLGRLGGNLYIAMELYHTRGNLIGSFTGNAKDVFGLVAVINENVPAMFRKISGVSSGPIIEPGIGSLQTAGGNYEFAGERRYLVNLSTEPPGAVLNFDGEPIASCKETPCKAELREGNVRIIAALEQYEKADTTVSVKQNNQSIRIRMKANFGVLEIKPAYWDDIGSDERWSLTINGKAAYSFENRLSPGKYEVELSNRCYEVIKFEAGINKDKPEFFDMASYIKEFVKKGGLVLSAEADGEPVAEPVFVNGKKVGETPFSGTVPVCSRVEIGAGREVVNVEIKHNAENKYKHTMNTEERKRRVKQAEELRLAEEQRMELEKERQIEWEEKQNAWHLFFLGGLGWATMLNSIDALYGKDGSNFSLGLGFFKQRTNFFHLGLNLDFGGLGVGKMKNELKKMYPDLDSIGTISLFAKMGAFARWYPTNFAYLSVGVYKGKYDGNYGTFDNGEVFYFRGINAIVFPVGGGLVWCGPSYNAVLQTDDVTGLYFETLYNIVGGHGGYWSFVFGINIDILSKKPSSRK